MGDTRLFWGLESEIPRGWSIVEESKDRALVGAGAAYNCGQQFGADISNSHAHTLSTNQMPTHSHSVQSGSDGGPDSYASLVGSYYAYMRNTESEGGSWGHSHTIDRVQKSVGVFLIKRTG
jgi:hypothetical protein